MDNLIIIILIINLLFSMYLFYKINQVERFSAAPTTQSLQDQIKAIYQADIQAIRNLSAIAASLQAGGLTVPGNLTNTGDFTATKAVNCNSLNIANAGGQITGANGNSLVIPQNATINGNLNIKGTITCGGVTINPNGTITSNTVNCNNLSPGQTVTTGNITTSGSLTANAGISSTGVITGGSVKTSNINIGNWNISEASYALKFINTGDGNTGVYLGSTNCTLGVRQNANSRFIYCGGGGAPTTPRPKFGAPIFGEASVAKMCSNEGC